MENERDELVKLQDRISSVVYDVFRDTGGEADNTTIGSNVGRTLHADGYRKTCPPTMTPEQAERLRDLFYAARKTTRATASEYLTDPGMRLALERDDAAVEAFNTALKEATR